MAEMVSSAVAQEVVSQVLSGIKERYERESNTKENMERMEIAHIRLKAALEMSEKWNITSMPLLCWQRKLKRVTHECDDELLCCRQRLQEEEELENRVRRSSFPKRILHSARLIVSSVFHGGNEDQRSTVRRLERFADGANEFVRYMELGGTLRRYTFFDPLVRHLLEGKRTKYCLVRGDQYLSFFLRPFSIPGYGTEAGLMLLFRDGNAPENNFNLGLHIRLMESTDIVGVTVRCMKLFTRHLRSTAETVKSQLTQLPAQDFDWRPYDICISSCQDERWDYLHAIFCKWFRKNPLCCQQQQQDHLYAQSSAGSLTCDVYLEPVTEVYLQGYVALSAISYKRRRVIANGETRPTRDFSYLQFSGLFSPHASSSEDLSHAVGGSATQMINGETTHCGLYKNISFEHLGEIMLPNAVDFLRGSAAATSYQMLWKSKHGGAFFRIKETSWRATNRKGRGGKCQKLRGKIVQGWTSEIGEFIGSWVAHAPTQLQGSLNGWVQKEKQMPPFVEEMILTA